MCEHIRDGKACDHLMEGCQCDHVKTIGYHRLGPQIGHGAQGEVYVAYDTRTDRTIALKLLYGGRGCVTEIKACARVDHPNVVPIYEAGEHEGWPYFTMKLLRGSLADWEHRWQYHADPEAAARLVATIARAVHHLHQHGILHLDLKPGNILLDAVGTPYVADFGVAKSIDADDHGTIVGTLRYMAPEQLGGRTSVHSDIYSLGVILFELLTDQPLFATDDAEKLAREIKERPPRDPRALRPGLHGELSRICLRCLEKQPEARHPSALALANALQRHLQGELPEGAPRYRRVWRWCMGRAVTAGLIVAALTFLVIMIPTTISLAREHEATKRAQLAQADMTSAAMVAGTVLDHLGDLGDDVASAARDPLLVAAVQTRDPALQRERCESLYRAHDVAKGLDPDRNSPFDAWFILDAEGRLTAQFGKEDVRLLGQDYAWRDYYQGAWALAAKGLRTTYVSRVFASEDDGRHKFALSTPIYERGKPIGVLVAAVATSAKLGSLIITDPHSTTALAGPRDRQRDSNRELEASHLILLHSGYEYGEADPLTNAEVERLDAASRGRLRIEDPLGLPPPSLMMASDDYRDPVGLHRPKYAGRFFAGFAPVGNTGFVVIVQTPYEDVLRSEVKFGAQLVQWIGISAVPGVLLMVFAGWYRWRRRARPRTAVHS